MNKIDIIKDLEETRKELIQSNQVINTIKTLLKAHEQEEHTILSLIRNSINNHTNNGDNDEERGIPRLL